MSYQNPAQIARPGASSSTLLTPGYTFLFAMKGLDMVTTIVGLVFIPGIVETNPIARFLFGEYGTIVGAVFFGGMVVIGATMVLEMLLISIFYHTDSPIPVITIRGLAYGSLSILYAITGIHNAQLITEAFSIHWLIT